MTWEISTDGTVTRWCSEQLGIGFYGPCQPFGIVENGQIVGAVVFTGWNHHDVEVAVVNTRRAWPRPFLRRLGVYAFDELKCSRVSIITRSDNARAVRVIKKFATLEGVKRRGFGTCDALHFGILKEEWRYA